MKLRIVIAILLALLIAEFGWLAYTLNGEFDAAVVHAEQERALIQQRTEEVNEMQAQLDNLQSENVQAIEQETDRLNEEIALLEQEKAQVLAEIEGLKAILEEKQEEYAEIEEDYSYYEELCNELEKGIETVKGYMAGN